MNSIKHIEHQQCRTCYDCTSNLKPLTSSAELSFSQLGEKTYGQLLVEVCNINIMDDKPLGQWPQFICLNCAYKLKLAHDFIKQTHKINQLLKSIADLLETRNKTDFIEKPELDIPLEIKIETDDAVEFLPNERVFQYSPVESEVLKAESTVPTYEKFPNTASNNCNSKEYKNKMIVNDTDNIKEIIVPSTIEFINDDLNIDDDVNTFYIQNKVDMDSPKSDSSTALSCSECNKLFISINTLNRHKRYTHVSEENKISCQFCPLKYSRREHLKRHLQTVHKLTNFQIKDEKNRSKTSNDIADLTCDKCNKIFNNCKNLSRHKRFVHIPEDKKLTCNFCDKKFGRSDHIKRHMRLLHGSEYVLPPKNLVKIKQIRFFCDKCDRSYTRRSRLYKHERDKHGK